MIDMGLVPPEEGGQQGGESEPSSSLDGGEGDEEEDEEVGGGAGDAEEEAEAVGLIGHFEAAHLMTHKGEPGNFVGSLDMSMTERELVSTEEGVGEMCCHMQLSLSTAVAMVDGVGQPEGRTHLLFFPKERAGQTNTQGGGTELPRRRVGFDSFSHS